MPEVLFRVKLNGDDEARFIYLVRGLAYGARAEFDPEAHEVGLEQTSAVPMKSSTGMARTWERIQLRRSLHEVRGAKPGRGGSRCMDIHVIRTRV